MIQEETFTAPMQRGLPFSTLSSAAALIFFLFCIGFSPSAFSQSAPREWTDTDGRTVVAVLVGVRGEEVQIRRVTDGLVFTWPRSRFSRQDREFISRWETRAVASASGRIFSAPPSHVALGAWPRRAQSTLRFRVETFFEDPATPRYVYRTPHFEFHSNIRLSQSLAGEFGQVFEATYAAIAQLPLGLAPQPSNGLYRTFFFKDVEEFHQAGGVPTSAGAYVPATGNVLVPLDYLGTRGGSLSYSSGGNRDHKNLIHEITHQMMHPWVGRGIPIWLFEGMAVYLENVPYERGTFYFDRLNIRRLLADNALRGNVIRMTDVRELMTMSERQWLEAFHTGSPGINYFSSFLLTYYFIHRDGNGDANGLFHYFRSLERGEGRERANQFLLAGRSYEQLRADIERSFQRDGFRFEPVSVLRNG